MAAVVEPPDDGEGGHGVVLPVEFGVPELVEDQPQPDRDGRDPERRVQKIATRWVGFRVTRCPA